MGYYDNDGQYHSFRSGIRRAAENIAHPIHGPGHHHHHHHHDDRVVEEDIDINVRERDRVDVGVSGPAYTERSTVRYDNRSVSRNTVTIPCHFIRIGDILILQGRPCQVIRITISAQTGQHRYLGVDLFTKQLQEESSFMSNPAPSVYVQNMLGPVFRQYRVLDMRDDGRIVAMTETGDVKQGLPVLDQSNLWRRISAAYAGGRGSVRVLVINDDGESYRFCQYAVGFLLIDVYRPRVGSRLQSRPRQPPVIRNAFKSICKHGCHDRGIGREERLSQELGPEQMSQRWVLRCTAEVGILKQCCGRLLVHRRRFEGVGV